MEPAPLTLTPRQTEVYAFVRDQILRYSMPPTLLEICHYFGWVNQWSAANHLKALERKGLITRLPGAFRGIRLTEDLNPTGIGTLNPATHPQRYDFRELFEEPEHFVVVAAGAILWNNAAINAGDHCIMSRNRKPKLGDVVAIDRGVDGVSLQQCTKGLKIAGTLAGVIRVL